ncbi:formate dehydrogenase major subunit/formate dehydrogenase alpha subunit [Thermosediminibacter litoriperuensis]|uniref:Formate dehydrogenase major subunit/formate dehydrogenase alpha subunit n=1 Tax=Thermosediminibacter litoriperuensis TaxID=291989 RepID=A0A5S5AXM2_9FIRM|nr:formate dehydrogenase major subunit/formate dehydrogenase alpha subunit [Thermosediminibacter litoriperuensis]
MAGLAKTMGAGAMTNSIEEITESQVLFVIGSNTTEQHPLIGSRVIEAVKNGAKLIVADPRRTYLAERAYIHLCLSPGTDVVLINAMINVIIEDGLFDENFIEKRTEGFEVLKQDVLQWTPERAERITGVKAEDIRRAARIYAGAERAMILYCMGITQHNCSTDNVIALSNLVMLTGNVGRPGTGLCPLRGQNNVQGACDMGALPDVLTGYQKVTDPNVREKFLRAWGAEIPDTPGLTVPEMFKAAEEGIIKAMYIIGENPAVSESHLSHVEKALAGLEFLVVQDIFLTETARFADVVLPACSFAEKDGTFTTTDRRVQRLRKAVEPLGNSKPDWQIIVELAARMGYNMTYKHPSEIMDEIASLTPSYGGISYDRLEGPGIQVPCPHKDHPGTPYLHKDSFARGKGKFIPVKYTPPAEKTDEEYPLVLTTGRVLYHYHTGTMTRKIDFLNKKCPGPFVEINPVDAQKFGISNGDVVYIKSRRGEIKAPARVTEKIKQGVVFVPFHFAEAAANYLTIDVLDPVAKTPQLKACAVNISAGGEKHGDN